MLETELYLKHGSRYSPAKPSDVVAAAVEILREMNLHKVADAVVKGLVEGQREGSAAL